jgi:hypothetical protein
MTSVLFWADTGRIFVYGDFVLPDPQQLLNLIKPLLHHDPPCLMDEACSTDDKELLLPSCRELSSRDVCMGYLMRLKNQGVLDTRLLPLLRAWGPDPSFHQAMLEFLAECHLICFTGAALDASSDVLVTARSRDLPAFHAPYPPAAAGLSENSLSQHEELRSKHENIRLHFNATLGSSDSCRVLFLLSRYHIGIISRLQVFIHRASFSKTSVLAQAAKDSLFVFRVTQPVADTIQSCCAVRVLPSCDDVEAYSILSAFRKIGGPLSSERDWQTKCCIVVAANDMALLAFMVRCVEDTLKLWSICADFQCCVEGPPAVCPFIQFGSRSSHRSCTLPLSDVLTGNLWNIVVPDPEVQMRDIFPRQRRCAMFLSYASNDNENTGTRYACETIRNGFQEAALCSVWMDRSDVSHSMPWKLLVREGLQAANVYIVCLTPLYLTRPHCLTELNDILSLLKMSPNRKRLFVLPLHPAMTRSGRQRIVKYRFVLLPEFQASGAPIVRKHVLSDVAITLLKNLSTYDLGHDDTLTDECLNTEPWMSSSLSDRQPNPKWNGVEATLNMCRGIVKREGSRLGSFLVCADDWPIDSDPLLEECSACSIPPSLEPLNPSLAKSSVVDSVDDIDPIFHMFLKHDAIRLAECGVEPKQLYYLVQNSSQALQSFPRYLQRLLKVVKFKSAENEFGSAEDLVEFLKWSTTPPPAPVARKVLFRVEGPDDKLLLHAVLGLKFPMLQRPFQHSWNYFEYNCPSASLLMRDRKVVTDKVHDVGIVSLVRGLQASASVNSFVLSCLDLDDQDLKAFETRPKQRPEKELSLITWRWGRAIENYLLPVTAPAALYLRGHDAVSKLTLEVFVTIAQHFFPAVSEMECKLCDKPKLCEHEAKLKLCEHKALKWDDLIGAGWKAWSSLLQFSNIKHQDEDTQAAAESLKRFSVSLLGVAALLVERHSALYGSSGCRADEWLLHVAAVRLRVRQGDFDRKSAKGKVENVDWKRVCSAILDLPAVKPTAPLNRGDADDTALWFNLPAVCSFLSNLCSCSFPKIVFDDAAIPGRVKDAAASALCLVQHALCVLLLGCDPASPAPQCTLFGKCPCFLPLVVGQAEADSKEEKADHIRKIEMKLAAVRCFKCGLTASEHTLPQRDSCDASADNFLMELCRVGSVGWLSHDYMKAVYGRTHLGEQFLPEHIDESHRRYEQHVHPLLYGGTVDSERCRELTLSTLPDITVYAITEGKTKEGRMESLLEQRRAEMNRLCDNIALLIGASPSPASPSGTPTSASPSGTPTSASSGTPLAAAAGGGQASSANRRSKTGGKAAAASTPKQSSSTAPSPAVASEASPSAEIAPSIPVVTAGPSANPSEDLPLAHGTVASSLDGTNTPVPPPSSSAEDDV